MNKERIALAGNALFAVCAVLVVTAALLYAGLRVYGVQFYEVTSSSMSPTFGKGSVVAAKTVEPHALKVGDIIVIDRPGFSAPYVHRITRMKSDPDIRSVLQDENGKMLKTTMTYAPRTIWTKGDANPVEDSDPSSGAAVRGKELFVVPWPFNLLVTHLGKETLFTLGVGAIALYVIWELMDIVHKLLQRRHGEPVSSGEGRI